MPYDVECVMYSYEERANAWTGTLGSLRFAGAEAYYMSRFLFAVQYLRTSLILPRIFTQAKIEWLQQSAESDNRLSGALNTS